MDKGVRNRASRWLLGGTALVVVGMAACIGGDDFTGPGPVPIEETEFAPELGVDLDAMTVTEDGLYYMDIELGEGEVVAAGDSVSVYYTGWLADGRQFDGTQAGSPVSFPIGVGYLIAGWELGVPGMREGGKRKLVIPYFLGYGTQHYGPIPAYSTLVFDIEVVEIHGADEDDDE